MTPQPCPQQQRDPAGNSGTKNDGLGAALLSQRFTGCSHRSYCLDFPWFMGLTTTSALPFPPLLVPGKDLFVSNYPSNIVKSHSAILGSALDSQKS